jgi:isopentenyl diphosphate isomerase/L-lactate dehydrogenase-like FMN-dependent dehydrogenase
VRRNRLAIDSLALRPRVLRDVASIDPSATLLGHRLRIPVVLAPIGGLETIVGEAALATARAGERFGVLPMISSISDPGLAAVGAATAGPKIAQIYVRAATAWADELIAGLPAAGYDAVALTVDSPTTAAASASCAVTGCRRRTSSAATPGSSGSRG